MDRSRGALFKLLSHMIDLTDSSNLNYGYILNMIKSQLVVRLGVELNDYLKQLAVIYLLNILEKTEGKYSRWQGGFRVTH